MNDLYNTKGFSKYIFQRGTGNDQTKIVYISAARGDDACTRIYKAEEFASEELALNPATPPACFKTCRAAINFVRNAYRQNGYCKGSFWFLIEAGTTCEADDCLLDADNDFPFAGLNRLHRVIVGRFGPANLPNPILRKPTGYTVLIKGDDRDYVTIKNLVFNNTVRDASHPDYNPSDTTRPGVHTASNPIRIYYANQPGEDKIITEDLWVKNYSGAGDGQGTDQGFLHGLVVNRFKMSNIYKIDSTHSSGFYLSKTRGTKIIDCPGHMLGHDRTNPLAKGTMYNQGWYLGFNEEMDIDGVLVDDAAHCGIQSRQGSGHVIRNCVTLRCPMGISAGHDQNRYDKYYAEEPAPNQVPVEQSMAVIDCLCMHPMDIYRGDEAPNPSYRRGSGLTVNRVHKLVLDGNIVALGGNSTGEAYGINIGEIGSEEFNAQFNNGSVITHVVNNNIIYNWSNSGYSQLFLGQPLCVDASGQPRIDKLPVGFVVTNNKFFDNIPQNAARKVYNVVLNNSQVITNPSGFQTNQFFSTDMKSRIGNSETSLSAIGIVTSAADAGPVQPPVSDNNFTTQDYMNSLGLSADNFTQRCLQQEERNYDVRFTATAYNNFVRAKFGEPLVNSYWGDIVNTPVTPPTPSKPVVIFSFSMSSYLDATGEYLVLKDAKGTAKTYKLIQNPSGSTKP